MRTVRFLAVLLISVITLSACSSSIILPPILNQRDNLINAKTVYVVKPDRGSRNIEEFIQSAIAKRGITASYGPMASKPQNADMYVTFLDKWNWDFKVYLSSLEVSFFDNKSGQLIASGRFENGKLENGKRKMHTFPDVQETVDNVVNSIFNGASAAPQTGTMGQK